MFSILYKLVSLKIKKIKKKKLKKFKYRNWRFFFFKWNAQSQYRANWNISRSYLLNSKLWYFQKKKNLQHLIQFKKKPLNVVKDSVKNISLISKVNDYIKKIFKKNTIV